MSKKRITLDEAIALLDEVHQIDPAKVGRHAYSRGALYNAIHKKRLTRYGPAHIAQVDPDELLKEFGPKKTAG